MRMAEILQFLFSGLTVGAIYALVALGFTLIYNASDVVNFAQGEFVMLGGMVTVFAAAAGVPLPLAALVAVIVAVAVGLLLHRLAIEPARGASAVTLIIITIGASIFLRGVAAVVFDKNFHSLPPLIGNEPWIIGGAALLPQSVVVLLGTGSDRRRPVVLPHRNADRQGDAGNRRQPAGGPARRHRHVRRSSACRLRSRRRSAASAAS